MTDLADIRRIAEHGIGAFPQARLSSAADWLRDFGEACGDARYTSLAVTLAMIADAFEDNYEQMWASTVESLDAVLAVAIPEVLEIPTPADARVGGSAVTRVGCGHPF